MNEATLLFKLLIVFDYLFNVLTGGGLQTCFSTRCYLNAERVEDKRVRERWVKAQSVVDRIMFEKDHCKKSYQWELSRKRRWIVNNSLLK